MALKADIKIDPLSSWIDDTKRPFVVAGPCSAETRDQVLTTAESLSKNPEVRLFRAGIWKPRTRPNSFEGVGSTGLKWMMEVEKTFGIKAITEVANKEHVKACLDAGLTHFWVGARTTVNPFSVQEIAEALEGTDFPVFIKNPLNPDLQLWIGAIERLNQAGLTKLVAVHRGFNTFQDHVFRNSPNWEIPVELKVLIPELPMLVDPSHISGNRTLLSSVAQKALDLGFDGMMIETHPKPDQAWSDKEQQLAVDDLPKFLKALSLKTNDFESGDMRDRLSQLRLLIDEIDHNLIQNLQHRMRIVEEIGEYKAQHGVTVLQLERWLQIIEDRQAKGLSAGLDSEVIEEIWNTIHKTSIRLQTELVAKGAPADPQP